MTTALAFELPRSLEATEPPEARGLDARRRPADGRRRAPTDQHHPRRVQRAAGVPRARATWWSSTCRRRCPRRSAATRADGSRRRASTSPPGRPSSTTAGAWWSSAPPTAPRPARGRAGETLTLPGPDAAHLELALVAPYASGSRLMLARLDGLAGSESVEDLLRAHGDPIRYGYVARRLAARRPTRTCTRASPAAPRCRARGGRSPTGSSPSWSTRGVAVAPITLHTGVSSPERHEPPFPEEYEVPDGHRAAGQPDPCRRRAG